ncbi:MAG: hypothetical protein ACKOTB_10490, partial [Planctomycetia bacterium]
LSAMLPGGGTMVHRRIKCFGAGESAVEAMLPDLIRRGREPLVGITAHEATITLRIAAHGRDAAECRARIEPVERTIRQCLGGLVFGVEDDEVEDAVVRALAAAGQSLATCEIGTEGRIAACLAQAEGRRGAGRTAAFLGGEVLPTGTAVPHPTRAWVESLAEQARASRGATLGLAAGPVVAGADGRGLVTLAVVDGRRGETFEHMLGGAATITLSRAARSALDLVRHRLRSPEAGS